jgi:membrane protease YdiL (CAAX protease family)
MGSMALVLWRVYSLADKSGAGQPGGLLSDLAVNPAALALTYLAAVPTFIFFTGLVMIVGLLARTYQEANAFATPVLLLPISAAAISVADPETTRGLLMTPIANTTVIIRDVLTGRATVGAFLLAFGSSCLYAGLLLSAAGRLFNTEQLVNPAWEPLSIKGLGRKRKGGTRTRRVPGVDEALALFAVTILLLLYVGPSVVKYGLLPAAAVSMALLIAAPTLLLAWWARYRWVETFSWRGAGLTALLGALLVGVGLAPWVNLLSYFQHQFWPASPSQGRQTAELFLPALARHPVLTPLLIGALAGICEELLYRGVIQASLLKRLPLWPALLITAALFAAAHMDLHGFPLRLLLGVVLGYVVWRGGSIFPGMVIHGVYDATQLGLAAWAVKKQGVARLVEQAANPAAVGLDASNYIQLAVGAVLLGVGGWLLLTARPSKALPLSAGFPVITPSPENPV